MPAPATPARTTGLPVTPAIPAVLTPAEIRLAQRVEAHFTGLVPELGVEAPRWLTEAAIRAHGAEAVERGVIPQPDRYVMTMLRDAVAYIACTVEDDDMDEARVTADLAEAFLHLTVPDDVGHLAFWLGRDPERRAGLVDDAVSEDGTLATATLKGALMAGWQREARAIFYITAAALCRAATEEALS